MAAVLICWKCRAQYRGLRVLCCSQLLSFNKSSYPGIDVIWQHPFQTINTFARFEFDPKKKQYPEIQKCRGIQTLGFKDSLCLLLNRMQGKHAFIFKDFAVEWNQESPLTLGLISARSARCKSREQNINAVITILTKLDSTSVFFTVLDSIVQISLVNLIHLQDISCVLS